MQPSLVILAAGLGSRFGGDKQIEKLGPSGETIMDYSIYDAIQTGFGKVVFVIKKKFKKDFINNFNATRYNNQIKVEYVYQETYKIPEGFAPSANRTKPWGTLHALLMAKDVVREPFASINADDFYGREAFINMCDFLHSVHGKKNEYCLIGFNIINTLVDSGGTSRAECLIDKDNFLTFIEERTDVKSTRGKISGLDMNKKVVEINNNSIVSMNFWGFTPDFFEYSHEYFYKFISKNINSSSSELLIQSVVNNLIKKKIIKVKVIKSNTKWFGVTYQKDKTFVVERLMKLINQGVYPLKLWQ